MTPIWAGTQRGRGAARKTPFLAAVRVSEDRRPGLTWHGRRGRPGRSPSGTGGFDSEFGMTSDYSRYLRRP